MSELRTNKIVPKDGMPSGASGGGIVQVVYAEQATEVTSSTNTYITSGLSAIIRPSTSSNKVLIIGNLGGCDKRTGNTYMGVSLRRNGVEVYAPEGQALWTNNTETSSQTVSFQYLDTPGSTSDLTYEVFIASLANTAQVSVQWSNGRSAITLMEVSG